MSVGTFSGRFAMRAARVVGLLVAVGLFPKQSFAQTDQVDRLIDQGVSLRLHGKLEEALDLFTRAHALAPSARTLAQMGLAEGALHRWIPAEGHLAGALSSHDTPWVEVPRNREALQEALAKVRSHVGTLKVVGPAGARVTIADREVARLPLTSPLRLAEGPVDITATAPGYGVTQVAVTIVGSTEQTVVLPLVPLPQATPPAPAVTHLDEPPPTERWKTWTGVALLGASAAAIATGTVWVVLDGHPSCPATQTTRCEWAYDTKLRGWLTIGGGVAAGAAGGILVWSARHVPAVVAAGPGSVALVGGF